MQLKDLVGKFAIRTAPTLNFGDHSYMDRPVKIVCVDGYNAIIEHRLIGKEMSKSILDADWLDDNWRECPKEILDVYLTKE